jgi:nucleoside-diphosphate-sugar epimerase
MSGTGPVFIVGCGDIGRRVARLENAAGRPALALARSGQTAAQLQGEGIAVVRGDLDQPASLANLPPCAALYYFAPPPAEGVGDPRLNALLAALPAQGLPERVVYISTSGVYGDCQGAWIDETWPLNPQTGRAQRRVAAESALQGWAGRLGVTCVILRVPGIYGPGRLPVERIRRAVPVVDPAEAPYSNRIHADDLAEACCAAARRGQAGAAYNISDGQPTTMTDYFLKVADALGLPHPPAISLAEARRVFTPAMLSFLDESKRLDNRRMREELDIALRYPDLASGLAASVTPGA